MPEWIRNQRKPASRWLQTQTPPQPEEPARAASRPGQGATDAGGVRQNRFGFDFGSLSIHPTGAPVRLCSGNCLLPWDLQAGK